MSPEASLALAFALAAGTSFAAVPLAIRVAKRTAFFDHPFGYKGHGRPTPYLGGAAIMAGFLVAVLVSGGEMKTPAVLLGCAGVLWFLGTLDDRRGLSPWTRVVAEAAAAAGLWLSGQGWAVVPGDLAGLLLTVVWVVGVVNAFNLMDNMDGAAAGVAATSALGAGALALVTGHVALAALCLAVAGACAGFLPYNLRSPARIFMGDGGSMIVGFLVAAVVMAAASATPLGLGGVVVAALLVGLVVLDTTLVTVSRRCDGRPLLVGGRDHLTHRLLHRLGSPRAVAASLACAQLVLCAAAVAAAQAGPRWVLGLGAAAVAAGAVLIAILDGPRWTARPAVRPVPGRA